MDPVRSNTMSKTCEEQISSNCITSAVPAIPGLGICAGASLTDLLYTIGVQTSTLLNDVDISTLDLGCLWTPTITQWTCPCLNPAGQTFLPDVTAPNGAGFCQAIVGGMPILTTCTPVSTTIPNPVPRPTTLVGVLQLMINKIPCCDPCNTNTVAG